jgi:hypothetical protein
MSRRVIRYHDKLSTKAQDFWKAMFRKFNGEDLVVAGDERRFYAYMTTTNEFKCFDATTYLVINDIFEGKITVEEGSKLLADAGFSKFVEVESCDMCNGEYAPKSEFIYSHEYYICRECFQPDYLEYDEDCECYNCQQHRDNNN